MEKELARMYLRICAAASDNRDGIFDNLTQGGLNNLLNTNYSGKFLPSPVIIPVVCNVKKISQDIKLLRFISINQSSYKIIISYADNSIVCTNVVL